MSYRAFSVLSLQVWAIESRFQRFVIGNTRFPGALPQAQHEKAPVARHWQRVK